MQQRLEQHIKEPGLPVTHLTLTTLSPNAILCPGDTLHYDLSLVVDRPIVGTAVINVWNKDTNRLEISSTTPVIYDQTGLIQVQTNWQLPAILPATPTRPERQWQAGHYRRLLAVASDVGDFDADPQSVDFTIPSNCAGLK